MNPMAESSTTPRDQNRKRRSFRRLHDQTKARSNDVYTIDEIVKLYGVDDQTVRNWCEKGLRRVGGTSRFLVRGDDLNAFHTTRNTKARRPLSPVEFYCMTCHAPREPSPCSVLGAHAERPALRLEARCSACGRPVFRAWSRQAATALLARSDLCPDQAFPSTEQRPDQMDEAQKLRRIATPCDSVSQDATPTSPKSNRTPEKPVDTKESQQLPLLFGF